MRAGVLFALSTVATATPIAAVQTPDLETLIQRLGAYVVAYEADVSSIIADEEYRQSETSVQPNKTVAVRRRTLHSEMAFLRLPGGREWFGVRNVLRVDGRQVNQADRLTDALKASGKDADEAIRAIVAASSRHNISIARTINMPMVPLEVLHPRHGTRVRFTLGRRNSIAHTPVQELRYRETGDGGLIRDTDARQMLTHGSVWVDDQGRVWRVTLELEHAHQAIADRRTADNELRVDFVYDDKLAMLVPREMREMFALPGGGRFDGRAIYSNYKRFGTAARIVPQ